MQSLVTISGTLGNVLPFILLAVVGCFFAFLYYSGVPFNIFGHQFGS